MLVILSKFVRRYPHQSLLAVLAMLFATLAEGFGISIFIPLLNFIINDGQGVVAVDSGGVDGIQARMQNYMLALSDQIGAGNLIAALLAVFVLCICVKCGLVIVAQRYLGYTSARIATDLRFDMLRALFRARWGFFQQHKMGKLVNGVAGESWKASMTFMHGARLTSFLIEATIFSVLAFFVSWQATLIAMGVGLFILLALKVFINKSRRAGQRAIKIMQELTGLMADALVSIKPLKAMGREEFADVVLRKKNDKLNRSARKLVNSNVALENLQEPLIMGFTAIVLYVTLIHLDMSLATVVAMVYLIRKVLKNIKKIQMVFQKFAIDESAYYSFHEKLEHARQEEETTLGEREPQFRHSIRLADVSFTFGDTPIFENLDLTLPKRKFAALIGHSGAGKTTLTDLVLGLLRPQSGDVYIDDLPLAEIDIQKWRHKIGYVPQETVLLHDTIAANVTLGDRRITAKQVEKALRLAGAWAFVSQLPQGVHTTVGEGGAKISGGQRQRISIARALVNQPELLILDEATTALDPETEAEICRTLQTLAGDVTILAISHQRAILEAAEVAYRLEKGGVIRVKDAGSAVDAEAPPKVAMDDVRGAVPAA